jgi:DNA-binding transcriptional MerR regulator
MDEQRAIYVISVAAELAGVHPQTLRIYERKGLLRPQRTSGNTRRYSDSDIATLRRIQELTNEGLNLAGVVRVMQLELELELLRGRQRKALDHIDELEARLSELLAGHSGTAIVPSRDVRRLRRAMKSDALDEAGKGHAIPVPPVELG